MLSHARIQPMREIKLQYIMEFSQNFLEKKSSTANASALLYTDTPPVSNWGGAIEAAA